MRGEWLFPLWFLGSGQGRKRKMPLPEIAPPGNLKPGLRKTIEAGMLLRTCVEGTARRRLSRRGWVDIQGWRLPSACVQVG